MHGTRHPTSERRVSSTRPPFPPLPHPLNKTLDISPVAHFRRIEERCPQWGRINNGMPMHTSCFVSNYQNKLKRRRTRPSAIVTSLRDHGTRSGMRPIILREAVQKWGTSLVFSNRKSQHLPHFTSRSVDSRSERSKWRIFPNTLFVMFSPFIATINRAF